MKSRKFSQTILQILIIVAFTFAFTSYAHASASAGGGLPYEAWLTKLQQSMTGPVAFSVSLIGIVGAGGVLIFGGELNAFLRTLVFIVLVMALLVGCQHDDVRPLRHRGRRLLQSLPVDPRQRELPHGSGRFKQGDRGKAEEFADGRPPDDPDSQRREPTQPVHGRRPGIGHVYCPS